MTLSNNDIPEVTPREIADRIAKGDDFTLLDVREPYEWNIAKLPGAQLIPLGKLATEMSTLDPEREIVIYCRSGRRSLDAAYRLRAAGFQHVSNLAGGILRWSDDVDPTIPKY